MGLRRRFARANALGYFRSEAGRICIKPLVDEEHIERQRLSHEQHMAQNIQQPTPTAVDANGFPWMPAVTTPSPPRCWRSTPRWRLDLHTFSPKREDVQ
jgi:hypothetical protein